MIKIYASGIQDLTVARYFAAMDVTLAGFALTEHNKITINGIKEWIQGPNTVAECDSLMSFEQRQALFRESEMDYLLLPQLMARNFEIPVIVEVDDLGQAPGASMLVYKVASDVSFLQIDKEAIEKRKNDIIYFDLPKFNPEWIQFLSTFQNTGIVVRTGTEEKPGIKSFDEVDALFELLEGY